MAGIAQRYHRVPAPCGFDPFSAQICSGGYITRGSPYEDECAEYDQEQSDKSGPWTGVDDPKSFSRRPESFYNLGKVSGCQSWLRFVPGQEGGSTMKKVLFGAILLTWALIIPIPTMAAVNVSVDIPLPPPIVFAVPPEVVVLPDTNDVYVVPNIAIDLFFWNGWWWRPWEGRWYRSHYYNRGWRYYNKRVPRFYFDIDPGWIGYYRDHNWYGHRWDYQPIPNRRLQQSWRSWQNSRYWEGQRTWGVQGYQPRPQPQRKELSRQRRQEYQQRPEVQQHFQHRSSPQGQFQERVLQPAPHQQKPQVQNPQGQRQGPPRPQEPQRHQQGPEVQQPQRQQSQERVQQPQPQRKPEGEEREHRR